MKKYSILAAFLAVASILTGCQDRLAEEFQNPETHAPRPEEIIPGMMTQMMNTRFFKQDYGEWWWSFRSGYGFPAHLQVANRRPHPSEWANHSEYRWAADGTGYYFSLSTNYATQRFNWFYTDLKNWGLMRDEVETLSGDDLANNEMFFLAATILKNSIALQSVDNFNKIPYSEAFQGTKGIFFPKYDEAKDVYVAVLDELADLASRIPQAHAQMSASAKESFTKNDLAFGGDPQKWVQLANALRLRHAVRMSGVDEATAKTHIAAAIQNLPKTDFIYDNPDKNQNRIGGEGGGIFARALYENSISTLIPNIIMQRMNYDGVEYVEGEDDPRLPAIATPSRYSQDDPDRYQFSGMSMDHDAQFPYWPTQSAAQITEAGHPSNAIVDNGPGITVRTFVNNVTNVVTWLRSGYSQYNIATFTYGDIPCYLTSLAEVDLLLAEVAAKNLATTGKSAADHIRDAVVHSTDMWYYINSKTVIWTTENMVAKTAFLEKAYQPTKPSSAVIERFADKIKGEFSAASGIENQMEIIMQQKYIHLNVLNMYELWAELRRTRHPKLEKIKVSDVLYTPMAQRLRYPNSESANNSENYDSVQSEDNFSTPIFWVPDSKKGESWYMDGYLPLKGFLPLPALNPNRPVKEDGDPNFSVWIP